MNLFFARRSVLRGMGVAALLGGVPLVFADDPIPKPFPMSHFEEIAAHSPFSPPTIAATPPPTPPPAPTVGFADKYTLASIMQQGDDSVATLNNKETSEHTRVRLKGQPNADGLNIASVEWANEITQTKVTLKKGSEFGVVEFDPNLAPAPSGAAAGTVVQRPNLRPVPPMPGQIHPPPGAAPNRAMPGAVPNQPAIRRPNIIRAPVTPINPHPGQPGVNFTNAPRKPPIPGQAANDDDDDNDDE